MRDRRQIGKLNHQGGHIQAFYSFNILSECSTWSIGNEPAEGRILTLPPERDRSADFSPQQFSIVRGSDTRWWPGSGRTLLRTEVRAPVVPALCRSAWEIIHFGLFIDRDRP